MMDETIIGDLMYMPNATQSPIVRCDRSLLLRAVKEIELLREALNPFALVASKIPEDWPEVSHLQVAEYSGGGEFLTYHGNPNYHGILPTLAQWRAADELTGSG